MKKVLFILLCLFTAQFACAQARSFEDLKKDSVSVKQMEIRKDVKQMSPQEAMLKAANLQKKSANMRALSISLGVAGGVVATLGNDKSRYYIAGGLGVLSIVSEGFSIYYQHKSGVCLEASAKGITFKF